MVHQVNDRQLIRPAANLQPGQTHNQQNGNHQPQQQADRLALSAGPARRPAQPHDKGQGQYEQQQPGGRENHQPIFQISSSSSTPGASKWRHMSTSTSSAPIPS